MSERHVEKFGDNEYFYNPTTGQWRPVSKPPGPDPDYLEEYSKEALAELDGEEIEKLQEEEELELDIEPVPFLDDGETVAQSNDLIFDDEEIHRGDLLYEEFSNIESWDDVVQAAAELSLDINENYFSLGKLVNFACSKRKPGRPGEEDRTVARLSGQINVNRSTLSMCAACEEFYRLIREDLPKQISLRQLNDARVNAGWKPGKEVEAEQLTLALNTVIEIVEGKWAKPKKIRTMTPADYAERIAKDAQRALDLVDAKGGDLPGMFIEIIETAQDIVEILK